MDRILIQDLQVYAYHGVAPEEKKNGQMFVVSLQVGLDLEKAAASDDLTHTLNYAELCNAVQAALQSGPYNLIEAAAMKIIAHLFRTCPEIMELRVLLKKPWAPMAHHLQYAGVELERKRGDRNVW